MPPDYPARLHELCREHGILYVDDEVQSGVGRTGKMWAIEHYDGVEPDLLVSGKSIGGGLPLAAVTGRAELMDAVPAGGLGGTFGGNPLSCAAAVAVLEAVREPDVPRARTRRSATTLRARLDDARVAATTRSARCAGSARCSRSSSQERTPDRAKAIVDAAFERGLLLLSCGLYGNVIRLLPRADDLRGGARRGARAARGIARRPLLERHAGHPDPRPRQALRRRDRRRRGRPRHRAGRVLHDARPVRLGQDDDAADDRGLRDARTRARSSSPGATSRGCRPTTARSTPSSRTTRCFRT